MAERDERKEILKKLIKRLHEGEDPEKIKKEFEARLKGVPVSEVAKLEEELIAEGMPREEIHRLCDVHIAMFKESIDQPHVYAPEGHPIYILTEEHKLLLNYASKLKGVAVDIEAKGDFSAAAQELAMVAHLIEHFKESEKHYRREENVLFPYLEKHGVTQPPKIMWMEHDQIRGIKKDVYALYNSREKRGFDDFVNNLRSLAISLSETLASHFYKENDILFPTALNVITQDEWEKIATEFDEIGYCCFTPRPKEAVPKASGEAAILKEGIVEFETGSLSVKELEAVLNSLPVDITFVDKDDKVKYFSQSNGRIFVRAKAVIGREVRQCHPQKSLHLVNKILENFKTGKKDVAEFWINLKGRLVYIRYFAVRDKDGKYIGCLEVTQDITDVKKVEGEKRLL